LFEYWLTNVNQQACGGSGKAEATQRHISMSSMSASKECQGVSAQVMNEHPVSGIRCFFVACMDAGEGRKQERPLYEFRQLLLHCSTFAHPWARTSIPGVVRRDDGLIRGFPGL
jgi:hypothetical protein